MSASAIPSSLVKITTPEWARDAVIYQLNTRQFTPQGTFAAAEAHLPRLRELGVDIVWLMPIHPIGEKQRKGALGSPYAVKNHLAVNAEFGALEDLKQFVATSHALGMKVILDWVPNHSAWDNPLVAAHPEWYARDHKGDFRPSPWWDWSDIIDFDYSQPGLREYMIDALCYWVREADIDGYRCDVAGYVPNDFWAAARRALDNVKPVFMLAEWEARDLHWDAFDMTYAWSWYDTMHDIVAGRAELSRLFKYYAWNECAYPREALRMTFVSNHDINAWDATEFEAFGEALHAVIVLSVLGEGMPLIYNGQEAGNPRRLAFFEKDNIDWQPHENGELYRNLIRLKKAHPVLHNGKWGARMIQLVNSAPKQVFSFVRRHGDDAVLVVLNFCDRSQSVNLLDETLLGRYQNEQVGEVVELRPDKALQLAPWGYQIFTRRGEL